MNETVAPIDLTKHGRPDIPLVPDPSRRFHRPQPKSMGTKFNTLFEPEDFAHLTNPQTHSPLTRGRRTNGAVSTDQIIYKIQIPDSVKKTTLSSRNGKYYGHPFGEKSTPAPFISTVLSDALSSLTNNLGHDKRLKIN